VTQPHLRALTGLRFVAALHVLVFHCTPWQSWRGPAFIRAIAGSGYVAVSLFFVLSGFILTYVHCGAGAPALRRSRFYASRFARIYPAYAFALALVAPFFTVHTIRTQGAAVFVEESVAVATLVQAHFPSLALAWNPPGWSLSAEAFFYALFPFVAPRLVACRQWVALLVAVLSYALCLGVPLTYLKLAPDGPIQPTHESLAFWLSAVRYSPVARFPEFVIGIVVGRYYLDSSVVRTSNRAMGLCSLVASAAIVGVLARASAISYPVLHNGLLAPLFALLIVSLAAGAGPLAWCLGTRPAMALGEASYSLYVLHVPLVILWSKAVLLLFGYPPLPSFGSTAAFLVFAVVAALLCQRHVERPLRRLTLVALGSERPSLAARSPNAQR
jgi:peptidoglycan/LPS O-acetylase OafA/YrhL